MLARDFIDDCLYNPHYGYFSTQAVIFDPDAIAQGKGKGKAKGNGVRGRAEGFDFNSFSGSTAFEDEIARRYGEFEGLDAGAKGVAKGPGRQVWHTPTELFKVRLASLLPPQSSIADEGRTSHGMVERSRAISFLNTNSIYTPTKISSFTKLERETVHSCSTFSIISQSKNLKSTRGLDIGLWRLVSGYRLYKGGVRKAMRGLVMGRIRVGEDMRAGWRLSVGVYSIGRESYRNLVSFSLSKSSSVSTLSFLPRLRADRML